MKEELKKELAKFYAEFVFDGVNSADYAKQNDMDEDDCLTLIDLGMKYFNESIEEVPEKPACGTVTVYFGQGITFVPAGEELSDGSKYDEDVCEVEFLDGMLEFQDAKDAAYWADELVNTMGAYIIPAIYPNKIVGLEKALENYNSNSKIKF